VTLSDRELIALAKETLSELEFGVWFAKYYRHLGRRQGSVTLRMSENQWRDRLTAADRKMGQAIDKEDAA
jgi:hypothetical protein